MSASPFAKFLKIRTFFKIVYFISLFEMYLDTYTQTLLETWKYCTEFLLLRRVSKTHRRGGLVILYFFHECNERTNCHVDGNR